MAGGLTNAAWSAVLFLALGWVCVGLEFDGDRPLVREEEGVVAVWLGTQFEEDDGRIGWFDHDYAEGTGGGGRMPVRELLTGFSYQEAWIDAAVAAAGALGVTHASVAFLIFDHAYPAAPGPVTGEKDAWFVGNVPFQRQRGA